ncbi:hypothetical protein GUJ93_ZPchr0006g44794 [Zizania palustris]|uniref:RRM domain-containing protein n=1 Tax=Zizania palustris TaxID=103762 RepID=A0A8J5T7J8_ZIZPA|nr:hypothetical protein GUJ93_ZPchr0006g44794 [Zizania palustris]
MAAAFAQFGALDEWHTVPDRATGRCRGYGFVTFHRRSAARRALADSSNPSASLPARATHDELRRFFSRFGEIEAGLLVADRATGQFRGCAIFVYQSPQGLRKALEEPKVVFGVPYSQNAVSGESYEHFRSDMSQQHQSCFQPMYRFEFSFPTQSTPKYPIAPTGCKALLLDTLVNHAL